MSKIGMSGEARAVYTHDTIVALCREVKELRELRDAAYRAGYRPPQPIYHGA